MALRIDGLLSITVLISYFEKFNLHTTTKHLNKTFAAVRYSYINNCNSFFFLAVVFVGRRAKSNGHRNLPDSTQLLKWACSGLFIPRD